MSFKKVLLGAAAVLASGAGAMAADLPAAAPAQYVKVCDTYGAGYFYLPGTTTCLRLSGMVRFDARYTENFTRGSDLVTFRARTRVRWDARTQTEYGTLRSFVELQAQRDNGDTSAPAGGFAHVRQAFIQFAGLTVGYAPSIFDAISNGTKIGSYAALHPGMFSDEILTTAYYTASFGNGFSASIGIEERGYREALTNSYAAGQTSPDVVANVMVEQAWGAVVLSAALHHDRGSAVAGSEYGFAVQGATSIALPMLSPGSKIFVQGGYSEGALSYAGANETFSADSNWGMPRGWAGRSLPVVADFFEVGGNIVKSKAWWIGGGFSYFWTPTVSTNFGVQYVDVNQAGFINDFKYTFGFANVQWTPVKDLILGLEVLYSNIDVNAALAAPRANDRWGAIARIQRNF